MYMYNNNIFNIYFLPNLKKRKIHVSYLFIKFDKNILHKYTIELTKPVFPVNINDGMADIRKKYFEL